MTRRIAIIAACIAVFAAAVAFSCCFGPGRRVFPPGPPRLVRASTSAEAFRAWEGSGARGRVAICFTRYLNALESRDSKDVLVTELAMHRAILRTVVHVVPDTAWPEVEAALSQRDDMRPTPEGFIGIFEDGRVHIQPLSRFRRLDEVALALVEPAVWSPEERQRIAGMLRAGDVTSDLLIVVRGDDRDAALFGQAIARR